MKSKLSFALLLTAVVALSSLPSFAAAGAVYTLNNSSSGNAVLAFNRSADGQIVFVGLVATGGTGTGAGLGNQGALAIDAANQFLFAVNAGSNDISVFRIRENGLRLVDRVPSGGKQPISLTVSRKVLYVLNNGAAVGGSDSIAGFAVGANGHLKPIVGGLPLSAASVGPAQIGFNTDGDILLVAEKNTNNIDVFTVDDDGVAVGSTVVPSAGQTPFGFAFGKRNEVFVSDALVARQTPEQYLRISSRMTGPYGQSQESPLISKLRRAGLCSPTTGASLTPPTPAVETSRAIAW